MHAQLQRWGAHAGPELVRLLMRQMGLLPCQPRLARVRLTEQATTGGLADLVGRNFTAAEPGVKLVGDITC